MGEQRPLAALNGFINAGLPADKRGNGQRHYYSCPDIVTDSFDSRRYLAPAADGRPQTEFFEYHWAHLMQGNLLSDLFPTFRRLLLRRPARVPVGLRGIWLSCWLLILGVLVAVPFLMPNGWHEVSKWLAGVGGAVLVAAVVTVLASLSRLLKRQIVSSFADVVRYLDTSPRSYAMRRSIRQGFVELLTDLHNAKYGKNDRYDRIIVVAHSLGAYIAYDGISYLWARKNDAAGEKEPLDPGAPDGLQHLEDLAAGLLRTTGPRPDDLHIKDFQQAQNRLWRGLRAQGHPWKITDFVTCGTPMYFADVLYTRTPEEFDRRVQRQELPTCPPQSEQHTYGEPGTPPRYSYTRHDRRTVLHDGAPFAVVRWTNLWFAWRPENFGIEGDAFGGPLQPLFGNGIRDIALRNNGRWARFPGVAHTRYFKYPDDLSQGSVTSYLRQALALDDLQATATAEQVAYALSLLAKAGFSTDVVDATYAQLNPPPSTGTPVRVWLRAMPRPAAHALIAELEMLAQRAAPLPQHLADGPGPVSSSDQPRRKEVSG
ncbi:hypothetical protein [Streptomyces sp. NPDC046909]|uniref:hypothetical protein n=1 Tax=Streptomyces sp. NPDC046909 TaxID=3155617 RepID=UPI0033EA9C49